MNCSCTSDIKVKPTEFCIFCVHKHLSTALALSEFIRYKKRPIDYRVAAQVNLAVLHLLDKAKAYQQEIDFCKSLEYDILMKNEFISSLEYITSYFWNISKSQKVDSSLLNSFNIKNIDESTVEFALLKISMAIELMKYEPFYESVNYSTAIGQLVTACWTLEKIDHSLGEQCRNIYHGIENSTSDTHVLENFRLFIMNKYI